MISVLLMMVLQVLSAASPNVVVRVASGTPAWLTVLIAVGSALVGSVFGAYGTYRVSLAVQETAMGHRIWLEEQARVQALRLLRRDLANKISYVTALERTVRGFPQLPRDAYDLALRHLVTLPDDVVGTLFGAAQALEGWNVLAASLNIRGIEGREAKRQLSTRRRILLQRLPLAEKALGEYLERLPERGSFPPKRKRRGSRRGEMPSVAQA
jgi:hypothetical protein